MKRLESILWNCSIKATADMGSETIAKPLFLTLLFYFQTFFVAVSLFSVVVVLGKEWLQMYCLLHCLKHYRNGKKNVCTCLKSQLCSVVVPGQQAGILKSLVAPAQLFLAAVSYE